MAMLVIECVQQDIFLRCGHLGCHGIDTCEKQPKAKGTTIILTNS